ncbi:MAG TPA: hypothetical protein QGF05_06095 [Dehalococcoidia bacterium]|nr:hypothetical protein [Dehalococcoidia bacterium]
MDFVLAPQGGGVLAVADPGRTYELWLAGPSAAPQLAGDWTANALTGGAFLAQGDAWSATGDAFLIRDTPVDDRGRQQGGHASEIQVIAPGGPERTIASGSKAIWTPDGEILFITDETVQRVDAEGAPHPFPTPITADAVYPAPFGGLIAVEANSALSVVYRNGTVVADLGSGRFRDLGPTDPWAHDGSILVFVEGHGDTRNLRIWSVVSEEVETSIDGIIEFTLSPDARHIAARTRQPRRILIVDIPNDRPMNIAGPSFGRMTWSPNGETLIVSKSRLSASVDDGLLRGGQVRAYNLTGRLLWAVRTRMSGCGLKTAWSPDGRWLAIGDQNLGCT